MSGYFAEMESLLHLPGINPQVLGCPLCSLVTTKTEVFRLFWE